VGSQNFAGDGPSGKFSSTGAAFRLFWGMRSRTALMYQVVLAFFMFQFGLHGLHTFILIEMQQQ